MARPAFTTTRGGTGINPSPAISWLRLTDANGGVSYSSTGGLQVGTGTVSAGPTYTLGTTTGSGTSPGIYRQATSDGRVLYLLTAAMLSGAGMQPGLVTALGMTVTSKSSSAPYDNFTIQMGNTSATIAGTAFQTGLTTVFAGSVTTVVGVNTQAFQTQFVWDGTSNVYVQMCYDNLNPTASDVISFAATAYQAFYQLRVAGSTGCTMTTGATPTSGNLLPIFTFTQPGAYALPPLAGGTGQVLTQQANGTVAFATPQWTQAGTNLYPSALSSNVGIGTATPATALDVVGSITGSGDVTIPVANDYKYSSLKQLKQLCGLTDFLPENGGARTVTGLGSIDSFYGLSQYRAPLHLPQGATIGSMSFYYFDNNASDVTLSLRMVSLNGTAPPTTTTIATVSSSGTSANYLVYTGTVPGTVIDNFDNMYYLLVTFGASSTQLMVQAARVNYTVDHAE